MMEFLNVEKSLDELDLKDDLIVADFGCGSGGWVIPLAKKLENGRVFAIDILEEALSALKSKTEAENLSNISFILSDIEENGSKLGISSVDLILITNLLFECENKKIIFEEAKKALRDEGKILVIDWRKTVSFGPEQKVPAEDVKKIAKEIGFKFIKEFEAGSYHYGLIFEK